MSGSLPAWDLTDFYPAMDSDKCERDQKKSLKAAQKFAEAYKGKVAKLSTKKMVEAIKVYEKLTDILGKLASYAQLHYALDCTDAQVLQFYQNIHEHVNSCSSEMLFFTLELNGIADKELKKRLAASADLAHYEPWIREVRATRKYQLSTDLEQFSHDKDVVDASWVRLFDETLAGLEFTVGKKKYSAAEVFDLLSSSNAATRKAGAMEVSRVLAANASTFSLVTNTLAKNKSIDDKWRGYARPISSRNVANQVEDEVVDALIGTVKDNYKDLSHCYYKWKAKQFGKKKLDWWDRNAPLPKQPETKYDWDESVELVLSAYSAFSPALAKHGKVFFQKDWIDVPPRPGKDSGAFAHPTVPSVHPYLLLNFQGKTRDVMTLAHELGHGVHQVLAAKQGALMADTPLTLAETASVFGEMLTFKELLRREENEKKRQTLIAGKVEDMLNTVVRQVAFCEFERAVHDERQMGEVTAERLGEIWLDVQKESLGPVFKFTKDYGPYWSYIPHFIHSPFYVYAYAFGDCLVNSLYAVYEAESEKGEKYAKAFEQKYIAMLQAGGTLRHKQLLAPFGLDASRPDFWQKGLDVIKGYINELN